jgi:hypothetical protein
MQMLLARFSEANSQLAFENDKLRVGRQALAQDHDTVLREIDYLRSRLAALETAAGENHMDHRSSSQVLSPSGMNDRHSPARSRGQSASPGLGARHTHGIG